jgi:arsenate reductase
MTTPLGRRLLAEFLGSAFLAAVVIGSGIAAQELSRDTGLRLLENAAATAAGLFAIILMFGPISGGHFNPVVSLVDAAFGGLYFFTSSTSFANPAITVGRIFSDTFAGIAPASVPGFAVAQIVGGAVAIGAIRVLYPRTGPAAAADVVVPHQEVR